MMRDKQKENKSLEANQVFMNYMDRLATFSDCSSEKMIATSYAAAGFSYAAESGNIYCDQCELTLLRGCDAHEYDALSLHRTFARSCKFLSKVATEVITANNTRIGKMDYNNIKI